MQNNRKTALCILADNPANGLAAFREQWECLSGDWTIVVAEHVKDAPEGSLRLSQLPAWLEPVGYYDQAFLRHSRALYQYIAELKPDTCWLIGSPEVALVPLQAKASGISPACHWVITPFDEKQSVPEEGADFPEQLLQQYAARAALKLADTIESDLEAAAKCIEAGIRSKPSAEPDALISVCIAHFNYGPYLLEQLHSLKAQSYKNFEVIVVDDGSSDPESLRIWEELPQLFSDKRFRFQRRKENKGLSASRNEAVALAKGDWLVFCDADNRCYPQMLENLMRAAATSGADLVTGYARQFKADEDGSEGTIEYYTPIGDCIELGWLFNVFGDANALIRRSVYEASGGFQSVPGYSAEDWELFTRLIWSGAKLQVVPELLFDYRVHGKSVMRTTSWERSLARIREVYQQQLQSLANPQLRSFWERMMQSLPAFHQWREKAAELWQENQKTWQIKADQDAFIEKLQANLQESGKVIQELQKSSEKTWGIHQQVAREYQQQNEKTAEYFQEEIRKRDASIAQLNQNLSEFNEKLGQLWQSRTEMDAYYQQQSEQTAEYFQEEIRKRDEIISQLNQNLSEFNEKLGQLWQSRMEMDTFYQQQLGELNRQIQLAKQREEYQALLIFWMKKPFWKRWRKARPEPQSEDSRTAE